MFCKLKNIYFSAMQMISLRHMDGGSMFLTVLEGSHHPLIAHTRNCPH